MRINTRNWLVWMKKQTGVDGFRLDACKHFPYWVTQDFFWNLKYNAGWANGGANMYAVGEYVGNAAELDTWINNVKTSNGGTEDMIGTFDFALRQELKNITSGNGNYDLGSIPGKQQSNRFRTVPFVNNHDTYRPIKDPVTGVITGWDSFNELGGGHIDPADPRIGLAYAIACAVDGSPQVFFEDLFDVAATGKRLTHQPTSTADLPVRDAVANIIWCHQKLNFKKGSYKVRWQAQDLLIIERGYKAGPENSYAIIGVNDNWTTWQSATIQTDFGPNRQLHDYSGANANNIWTDATGKVTIWTPPCNGSNLRRGYTIWGPAGITGGFAPAQRSTTQEWEMANDLGDNHPSSLKQGGAIPSNSTAVRTVGKVFNETGKTITVNVYPTDATKNLTVSIRNSADAVLATTSGTGTLTLVYTPGSTGFYTIKIGNTAANVAGQNAWVKVNYTSPRVANTAANPASNTTGNIPAELLTETDKRLIIHGNFPDPVNGSTDIAFTLPANSKTTVSIHNTQGQLIKTLVDKEMPAGRQVVKFNAEGLSAGMYIVRIAAAGEIRVHRMMVK
jgi:alpha-amylase